MYLRGMKIFTVSLALALHLSSLAGLCHAQSSTLNVKQPLEEMVREVCLEKAGYKPLDNSTFFRVVEVQEHTNVSLSCSYCGESVEDVPRVWMKWPRGKNTTVQELELGLAPVLEENRLFTFPNHSLILQNVTTNDTGLYYCKSLEKDDDFEFQFSLDVVQDNITVIDGKTMAWMEFNNDNIMKVNEMIYQSKDKELETLLDMVKVRVTSEWDPWLPCDGCTATRKRYAKCRLRSHINRVKYPDISVDNLENSQKLFHQSVVISCHSLDLARWFPYLYSLTESVPNFVQNQICYDSCLHSQRMAFEPRYHLDIVMDVGTSMSFVCPDSDFNSNVVWRKDGGLMRPVSMKKPKRAKKKTVYKNPFEKKPKEAVFEQAFVDRINVLHLSEVRFKETGLYICYVNTVVMKSFNVTVVTAEETQRQRFYHFILLSCYTSLVSGVIVALGIARAFMRRDEFLELEDE